MDLAVDTQIEDRQSVMDILDDFIAAFVQVRPARSFQNSANAIGLLIQQLRHLQQRSGSILVWKGMDLYRFRAGHLRV